MPARVLLAALACLCIACVAPQEPGDDALSASATAASSRGPLPFAIAAALALPTRSPDDCWLPRPGETPPVNVTPGADVRIVSPSQVVPPPEYEPLSLVEDEDLAERLREMLGDAADTYAVVVKDLRTGRGVAINADRVFYAASVFKLFVMYEAFRQESLGLLQWTDQLVMTPYYDSFGFNVRGTALCDTLTVGRAARAMMTVSDNAAAVLLQDLVGSRNVNRSMEALGLVASEISEELPITAADVALLLEAIGRGRAVSMEASEEMIALMKGEALDNGLAKDLPDGVELAHKTGNWSNATHDAGIVFAPRGAYVIVVLSDTDHETALIREIARAVYERHEGSGR